MEEHGPGQLSLIYPCHWQFSIDFIPPFAFVKYGKDPSSTRILYHDDIVVSYSF